MPADNAVLEQNILVANFGDRVVLFDTGMGNDTLFGDSTGKLQATLRQAGIDPADVDAVVMSHAHIDHCGGLISADGKRNFPNAQYFIGEADFNYWTDESKIPSNYPARPLFLNQAKTNLLPVKEPIHFYKDNEQILPGVTALSAPGADGTGGRTAHLCPDHGDPADRAPSVHLRRGSELLHTVSHTIVMIESNGKQLCYVGDLAHHPVLLLEHPRTQLAYDTDPVQSAESRVRMLSMLSANRTPLLAYHFAWPGVGHVAVKGDGFEYYPLAMQVETIGEI